MLFSSTSKQLIPPRPQPHGILSFFCSTRLFCNNLLCSCRIYKKPQMKKKMHPNLKFARAWLLKGSLGVPDLCDMVVEYAKHFLPNFSIGSKFLILGGNRQGRAMILKDLLHRRKHRYKHGEAVTHVKNHQLCFSNVYSSVDTLSKFLRRADKGVWVRHELPADATKSGPFASWP